MNGKKKNLVIQIEISKNYHSIYKVIQSKNNTLILQFNKIDNICIYIYTTLLYTLYNTDISVLYTIQYVTLQIRTY